MSRLNYNHLRYFWAIAHAGSLTRAAQRLHVSQSALSIQLQKLEQQLGHALFERAGRRLKLTEAGRIALDYADTVFRVGEELLGTLQGRSGTNRRVLRVGALTTLSRNFQLEFLRPLLSRADVDLVVRSGAWGELLTQLESHSLDVVLANRAAPRDSHLQLGNHVLDQQPVSLVGRPLGRGRRFRFPDDLRQRPLLLPGFGSDLRLAFDQVLERAGIRPQVLAEVDDMAMLRLLARERDGVTLVPPIVVRDELQNGTLVEYCRIPDVVETFYAITQKRRFRNDLLEGLLRARSDGA